MDYIVNADILKVIDQDHLDYLTANDPNKLDVAEATGIEELSAYIDIRYDAAASFLFDNKKSLLAMYLVDVMLYHLHARIAPDNVPELRQKRYESAMEWADKVADGFINANLPAKAEEEIATTLRSGSQQKQSHYF